MTINELKEKFDKASAMFSSTVQVTLSDCPCDPDTRNALDEIARQAFYAITETQDALIEYLKSQ